MLLATHLLFAQKPTEDSFYRPQFHFSPRINWINDPNGLVYLEGEYHLFFQHNPFGSRWGHMTWGHAVSRDLVGWQELPIAIAEAGDTMIFSGSVVVDSTNSGGFGQAGVVPLIAIYTAHQPNKQSQHLAYSLDKGRTWTKYNQNPILDFVPTQKDFRDPNVFWHEASKRWLMAVVLPHEQKALFYTSKNLRNWELGSEFQVKNPKLGIWECPALLEMPDAKKWLLLVSVGNGAPAGGSGMQYFVGDFDGKTFTPQDTSTRYVDHGPDFYAAIPYNNSPRRLMLGWMNNWSYANDLPTEPFRGQMALPRELSLTKINEKYELRQTFVAEHNKGGVIRLTNDLKFLNDFFKNHSKSVAALQFEAKAEDLELWVRTGKNQQTRIGYDAQKKEVYLDRQQSGQINFHKDFAGRYVAPLLPDAQGNIKLHVLIDRCSIEILANDGAAALTCLVFPEKTSNQIRFLSGKLNKVVYYVPSR